MNYIILSYYDNKEWNNLIKYLEKFKSDYKIITDNIFLYDHLIQNRFDISVMDELVPERGEIVQEIYKNSKKWIEDYRNAFKTISHNNIEIFSVLDFTFFRQLHYLARINKIIENQNKPIIFIFKRFFPMFYGIKNIIQKNKLEVGIIQKNNIEFFKNQDTAKKSIANRKIKNFLRSPENRKDIIKNINKLIGYTLQIILEKIKKNDKINFEKNLKNNYKKIEKQIKKLKINEIETFFLISGSREDLYIKPLEGIFKKYLEKNKKFIVITDNISTSMALSRNNIQHLNLDKDIKILSNQLKNSELGKTILEKIDNISKNNCEIMGLKNIKNFMTELILKSYITLRLCELLLSNFKPNSVYAGLDGEILENSGLNLSKNMKILGFSMIPSLTAPNPIMKEWFHAEKIFVPGKLGFELLKNMGYEEERIELIGHPKYDFLANISLDEAKNKLKKVFDFNSTKQVILIAMSQWNDNDEEWMSEYIQFCNSNNYEIIIKIHPLYITSNNELSEKKIRRIKKKCVNNKYFITYDFDIYDLISVSDIVITDYSNVGIEAILLKKPLLTVNFNQNPWNYLKLEETGAAIEIKKLEELKKKSQDILEKKLFTNKNLETIIENYNFKNDGKASDRIFKQLTSRKN
jgi:hypothetical protein